MIDDIKGSCIYRVYLCTFATWFPVLGPKYAAHIKRIKIYSFQQKSCNKQNSTAAHGLDSDLRDEGDVDIIEWNVEPIRLR